ncbi:MAG: TetR family transcriptional regulator [Chitinivibrionales bacterium]|nr:TetR family transcriptional regulator [Chitinivibrionales bacterium]
MVFLTRLSEIFCNSQSIHMINPREAREKAVRKAKSDLIQDAACRVFARRGFHETRLEDIAAEAGFSKASLYNYYTDKEEIFLSLAVREYRRIIEEIDGELDDSRPFLDNMKSVLFIVFTHFGEQFALILTISNFQTLSLLHAQMPRHESLKYDFEHELGQFGSCIAHLIRTAKKRGEIQTCLGSATLAGFIGGLIQRTLADWRRNGAMGDVETAVNDIVEFITSGICVEKV